MSGWAVKRIADLEQELVDQKAITELAVKALKWYADVNNYRADPGMPSKVDFEYGDHARSTLSEIERLSQ